MGEASHPFTRVSAQLLGILAALLDAGEAGVHGYELRRLTGYSGPTVYTILDRLAAVGWARLQWQDDYPVEGRPRRRLCWLLPEHVPAARALLAERAKR